MRFSDVDAGRTSLEVIGEEIAKNRHRKTPFLAKYVALTTSSLCGGGGGGAAAAAGAEVDELEEEEEEGQQERRAADAALLERLGLSISIRVALATTMARSLAKDTDDALAKLAAPAAEGGGVGESSGSTTRETGSGAAAAAERSGDDEEEGGAEGAGIAALRLQIERVSAHLASSSTTFTFQIASCAMPSPAAGTASAAGAPTRAAVAPIDDALLLCGTATMSQQRALLQSTHANSAAFVLPRDLGRLILPFDAGSLDDGVVESMDEEEEEEDEDEARGWSAMDEEDEQDGGWSAMEEEEDDAVRRGEGAARWRSSAEEEDDADDEEREEAAARSLSQARRDASFFDHIHGDAAAMGRSASPNSCGDDNSMTLYASSNNDDYGDTRNDCMMECDQTPVAAASTAAPATLPVATTKRSAAASQPASKDAASQRRRTRKVAPSTLLLWSLESATAAIDAAPRKHAPRRTARVAYVDADSLMLPVSRLALVENVGGLRRKQAHRELGHQRFAGAASHRASQRSSRHSRDVPAAPADTQTTAMSAADSIESVGSTSMSESESGAEWEATVWSSGGEARRGSGCYDDNDNDDENKQHEERSLSPRAAAPGWSHDDDDVAASASDDLSAREFANSLAARLVPPNAASDDDGEFGFDSFDSFDSFGDFSGDDGVQEEEEEEEGFRVVASAAERACSGGARSRTSRRAASPSKFARFADLGGGEEEDKDAYGAEYGSVASAAATASCGGAAAPLSMPDALRVLAHYVERGHRSLRKMIAAHCTKPGEVEGEVGADRDSAALPKGA